MEIKDVLFFDTETTGVPDRSAKWETDYMGYPHIVQIAWMFGGVSESHIIRPDGWEIPAEATEIHGITTEYAKAHGESFYVVMSAFVSVALRAALLCGHNIHFDTAIIKANILREFGPEYYRANDVEQALYKGKRIDTMRPTMKWVDARFEDGRLKFPNLGELYARCFPGETFPAHDALADTEAVARCLPVLIDNGLVELKIKVYPDEMSEQSKPATATVAAEPAKEKGASTETAENGPISDAKQKDDKLPIPQEKAPQIENLKKISEVASELLGAENF